ncbi:MAG TPA: ParB/RepB/Spo0J family partition protein, partial [Gemmatimonadetes bacterium]|nr:ParB/RepB/Spo0J family partition protein [Gemmatimonadota bacterium]
MVASKRKTLGRGLASLIPEAARIDQDSPRAALASAAVVQVPLDEITANPLQPRRIFESGPIDELAGSIREHGVIQPLLLRPSGSGYEIVVGERRFRAARVAGIRTVPALVRRMDDAESLELALIENIQREDLNIVEEAEAYRDLIDQFGYSQEELSRRVGKDRSTISNTLRLLKLPDEVLDAMLDPNRNRLGIFPELVLYDCQACHHTIDKQRRWRPRKSTGLGPGVVRLNDANFLMLVQAVALVDPGTSKKLRADLRTLHQATSEGRGSPEK